jgi:hypothetical protein
MGITGHRVRRMATVAALAVVPTVVAGTSAHAVTGNDFNWPRQVCSVNTGPVHFRTPDAAMRYLARAWNCRDLAAVKHVSTPVARHNMLGMSTTTSQLRFSNCDENSYGTDYHSWECTMDDVYPKGTDTDGKEMHQILTVYSARNPGFYVTVDLCGG